ncbi:histidinol-phosphate aminotransferase family protein [bacterium]|jgi:histidinol-phosphate aminotransferase|nr:histidinol-phosphate aminotransferase family protein [bacterium]MBT6293327.1 histidinol-phosphate aminotransferase family protein [bacterium]
MIKLSQNELRYKLPEKISNINLSQEECSSYDGAKELNKKAIDNIRKRFNVSSQNSIYLDYGAEKILMQIFNTLNKESKVLISNITWSYYLKLIKAHTKNVDTYKIDEEQSSYNFNVEDLQSKIKNGNYNMVVITTPLNPTGNSIEQSRLSETLELCNDVDLVLLDEAYHGFDDSYNNQFLSDLVEKHDNLISVRTFSKLYAIAGIRIGYAISNSSLDTKFPDYNTYLGYSSFNSKTIISCLNHQNFYKDIQEKINSDKQALYDFFSQQKNWNAYKSNTNFILIKIPYQRKQELKNYLKDKIAIKFFPENDQNLKDKIRISIGTQKETQIVIEEFQEFIKQKENGNI